MRTAITTILLMIPLLTQEGVAKNRSIDEYLYRGLNQFKAIMARTESSNNPDTTSINEHYRGLYQFGKTASQDVHVCYDSLFIPQWADTALVRYMRINWRYLDGCHQFVDCTISDVRVTKAGMLAAAHLRGHAWVRAWIMSNGVINGKDLNGTSVRDYMKMMENVDLIMY